MLNLSAMRRWIDIVLCESYEDYDTPQDWRAWITPDGELQEVHPEVTHAEHLSFDDLAADDEGDAVDAAFAHAIDTGWIRVGINELSFEFFATCDARVVTMAALATLSKVVRDRHATAYTFDMATGVETPRNTKQMQAAISRLMRMRRTVSEAMVKPMAYEVVRLDGPKHESDTVVARTTIHVASKDDLRAKIKAWMEQVGLDPEDEDDLSCVDWRRVGAARLSDTL